MATKKQPAKKAAAKPAPKATKTIKTSTGKTKTMPSRKPATKPNSTRSRSSSNTSSKSTVVTNNHQSNHTLGSKIACVIGVIATIALVVIAIAAVAHNVSNKINPAMIAETGDGEKIVTKYVNFNDDSFRIKVPTTFVEIDENKADSSKGDVIAAYRNEESTATLLITSSDEEVDNEHIKTVLDSTANVLNNSSTSNVEQKDFYSVGQHNVGSMRVKIGLGDQGIYEDLALFAQDKKLITIVFSYGKDQKEQEKWQPIGEFIIKSLDFLK